MTSSIKSSIESSTRGMIFAATFALSVIAGFSMLSLAPHSARAASTDCGCQQPPPPITGICTGTPSSAETGATVTWTASELSGGSSNDRFTFSWSGTDGLSGSSQTVQKVYTTAGQKSADVTVYGSSTDSPATFSCSVTVTTPPPPPPPTLMGSCSANPASALQGSPIVWTASPTGGTGSYAYVWSGSDNLGANGGNTGVSISHTYSNPGTYSAQVAITSGSQEISKSCSVTITSTPPPPPPPTLMGSCSANPATALQGNPITWTATATGGNGSYAYLWTGDDNLATNAGSGGNTTASISHTYANPGTYNAQVVITSNSQTINQACSVVITATPVTPPPPSTPPPSGGGGGGLNQPNVSFVSQTVIPAPYAADYITLTQVPYTGLADYPASYYFIAGLVLWSLLISGIYTFRKRNA